MRRLPQSLLNGNSEGAGALPERRGARERNLAALMELNKRFGSIHGRFVVTWIQFVYGSGRCGKLRL